MEQVTAWLAFGGGILAFISPCTLPLYPSFISYITGVSISDFQSRGAKSVSRTILVHSILFLVGFSTVYYLLGFSASLLGHWFEQYRDLIRMLGGVFIFLLGSFILGLIRPRFLIRELRFSLPIQVIRSKLGSILAGIVFAAGWTPCIGPIFGAIMYSNMINPTPWSAFVNITAYALGFGIPFVMMGYFIGKIKSMLRYSELMTRIGGALMMVLGGLLYFDLVSWLNLGASDL